MNAHLIAIPSENPRGLDAPVGAHFGHCDLYTQVQIEDGKINHVDVIPKAGWMHGAGSVSGGKRGVKQLIAGGMGLRNQVGIKVFHGTMAKTVGEAVQSAIDEKLIEFTQNHTCGGGGL